MRTLVSFCCFVAVFTLTPIPAQADGPTLVDLVVREQLPATVLDLRNQAEATPMLARPATPVPLHLRLDPAGRVELLLRVGTDRFLGKLALAL